MSNELDDVARSLFLGHIPHIWRKLAPDTLKTLGNWMVYFLRRYSQYTLWVSAGPLWIWLCPLPLSPGNVYQVSQGRPQLSCLCESDLCTHENFF